MDFVVDRKTWYRGKGPDKSALLLQDGMRCCLGHVAKQCGITDIVMLDRTSPSKVCNYSQKDGKLFPTNFFQKDVSGSIRTSNSFWIQDAMTLNDNPQLPDPVREQQLSELFAANGHSIKFEN